jgi:predicted nucleotide-binding protein (sugar kinase/HSP70/actin superfamily)
MVTGKVRVGIPRSLFYYNFAALYCTFFMEMGAEVIVSSKTNRQIIADGVNASNNELCLPIKLLFGHILDLKGRVDYIFLPYIISTHKGSFICPKLIGAPDIIRANLDVQMLSPDLDMNNIYTSTFSALKEVAMAISANPVTIYSAYKKPAQRQPFRGRAGVEGIGA